MEPSYQARKIIGRILVLFTLLLMAGGFWAHYTSALVRQLTTRQPIRIAVLTDPAMLISYTPTTHKARILIASHKCTLKKKESCFNKEFHTFYIPKETSQHVYWTQFGENLERWRFAPVAAWNYLNAYINALVQKRTNLRPSEFMLLSKELIELTRTDFAVEYPTTSKKKKNAPKKGEDDHVQSDEQPEIILPNTAQDERPLVVEVLNASGKKGLALQVTQYLREQNAKGILRIDVINYDNYPSAQEESFIVDYSNRQVQVSQASQALGIRGEIRSEKSTTAICNARIVLGKDFKMPL